MNDSNIPKLTKEDLPIFKALIYDLFPDISVPEVKSEEINK